MARDYMLLHIGQETQKRRLRRQRILESALPCMLLAALVIAALFTAGHENVRARMRATMLLQRSETVARGAAAPIALSSLVGGAADAGEAAGRGSTAGAGEAAAQPGGAAAGGSARRAAASKPPRNALAP